MTFVDPTASNLEQFPKVHGPQPQPQPQPAPVTANQNALVEARSLFPYADQIGISDLVLKWVQDGLSPDAMVAEFRKSPQHKAMFPGLFRSDGTIRMNEAEYIRTRDSYRQLAKQYGRPDYEYANPADFKALFEQEIDPNEFRSRLQTYDAVKRGSADVKSAFYVYAGMKLSDDDLYTAAVDPAAGQKLVAEYSSRAAKTDLTYEQFITRATEAGLDRAASSLSDLVASGIAPQDTLSKIGSVEPDLARHWMDQLYHGNSQGHLLDLNALQHSFELAMIGGAATAQGLSLPDQQRVEALRQAGIDRSQALQGFGTIARHGGEIQGMLGRSGQNQFSAQDFDQAVLLHQGPAAAALESATAQDRALQQGSARADVTQTRSGLIGQRGLAQRL